MKNVYAIIIVSQSLIIFIYASVLDLEDHKRDDFQKIVSLIQKKSPFFDNIESNVGVFIAQEVTQGLDDILTSWLKGLYYEKGLRGVKIRNHGPDRAQKISLFTDTVIFMENLDEHIIQNISCTLFSKSGLWHRDKRFVFVLSKKFIGTIEDLRSRVKIPWKQANLLNYVVICMFELLPYPQILTYNPYNGVIQNFSTQQNYTATDLYPPKLKNLFGHNVTISYCLYRPYVVKSNGKLGGTGYDFATTFIKYINGTVNKLESVDIIGVGQNLVSGRGDLSAIGFFLFEETIHSAGYPHGFMDVVVFVPMRRMSSVFSLIYICDKYAWLSTLLILVMYHSMKLLRYQLFFSFKVKKPEAGMKILVFTISSFNIFFSVIIQCWITTFIIHPPQHHNIDTIDELIESKQPIHSFYQWKAFLTSKLDQQFVFNTEMMYVKKDEDGKIPAYVATADAAVALDNDYKFSAKNIHAFHQVKEQVGTTFMVFYLCPTSPYKRALKDFTMKSLAYGSFSKSWGLYYKYWTEPKHKMKKMQMKHIFGLLIVWSIGVVLGSLVFVLEITWRRCLMLHRVYEFMN